MKCSLCNSYSESVVHGPIDLCMCHTCIEGLSDFEGIEFDGTCTWCGGVMGEEIGIFGQQVRLAVAINNKESNIVLCNECGKLCNHIINEMATA